MPNLRKTWPSRSIYIFLILGAWYDRDWLWLAKSYLANGLDNFANSKLFIINEIHGYIWSARNYTIATTLVSLPIQVPRGEGPPCHLRRQRKWIIVSPSINQSHDFHLHNTVLGWLGCISEQNWPQFDKF
jgi:hypothetical protein